MVRLAVDGFEFEPPFENMFVFMVEKAPGFRLPSPAEIEEDTNDLCKIPSKIFWTWLHVISS